MKVFSMLIQIINRRTAKGRSKYLQTCLIREDFFASMDEMNFVSTQLMKNGVRCRIETTPPSNTKKMLWVKWN